MAEIHERIFPTAEERADGGGFLVRQLEKPVEQTELAHHLEGRWMNGIAAEVPQEIGVLLEHHDVDAGARQQQAEHEPARPATDDAATRGNLFGRH